MANRIPQQGGLGGLLDVPDPSPLPEPGLLTRLLFESEWTLAIALGAAGIFAFLLLNSRGRAKDGLKAAGVAALLAVAALFTSRLVTTEREQMAAMTRDLVAMVARGESAGLRSIFSTDARLTAAPGIGEVELDRVLSLTGEFFGPGGRYELSDHRIRDLQATTDGPNVGRVQVKVWVKHKGSGWINNSWWLLDYQRDAAGEWKVVELRALAVQGR